MSEQRIRLLMEGVPTSDGRLLEPGSVTWKDEPLPLMTRAAGRLGEYSALLGRITDVRREDDGSITGIVDTDWTVTCDCDQMEYEDDEDTVIRSARLRGGFARDDGDVRWLWPDHPQRAVS